jgi:hypothetical protein
VHTVGDITVDSQRLSQGRRFAGNRLLGFVHPRLIPCATMKCLLAVAAANLLTGCLSNRYKAALPNTPPAVQMNLEGVSPEFSVALRSVVVFQGPGSWKKEAYWDEYLVTLSNRSDQPVIIKDAALIDQADVEQVAGDDPWELERHSREKLKEYEHTGRTILLGAGLGAAWFGAGVVTAGTALGGGSATIVAAGTAVVVALPVLGIGTIIRTLVARSDIQSEFQRRRLVLPITLAPHESRSGSLFFAVTPSPKRLLLYFPDAEATKAFSLPLAPLAGLHLPSAPAEPAPKSR